MTDRAIPYLKKDEDAVHGPRRVNPDAAPASSFRKYGIAALILVLAPAVQAEPWTCGFTAECVAGGACSDAAFGIEVIAADHEGQLFFRTASGATPALRLSAPDVLPVTYAAVGRNGIAEMLTIEQDATALFTLHIFDGTAQAATYFGTCEDLG